MPGRRREGVSELYASLLMVAVTISFGGTVSGLAMGQFGSSSSAASLAAAVQQQVTGFQVDLVYASTSTPGSCPSYQGAQEGTVLSLTLFNYGASTFAPEEVVINGSQYYSQSYSQLGPEGISSYSVSLLPAGTCAHSTGETVLFADAYGDEIQVGT